VSAPITAERLAEIEARANAATPGPWWPEHRGVMAEGVEIVDDCAVAGWDVYPENQAFIAAARIDVPDLVAEVRRLTAALDAAADGATPITAPLREPSACERCGGRRAVAKMSGPIPCPACVPPVRVPCAYCVEGVALGTGEACRECDGGVR
jgi:hypothetical protein